MSHRYELSARLPVGLTLARAESGPYYDGAGAKQTAGVDVARFDYNQISKKALGLLIDTGDDVSFDNPSHLSGKITIEVEFHFPDDPLEERYIFEFSDAAGDNAVQFYFGSDTRWHMRVYTGGVLVCDMQSNLTIDAYGWHRAALRIAPNDFAFYVDGTLIDTNTIGAVPGEYTIAYLGQNRSKTSKLRGSILRFNESPARAAQYLLDMVSNVPTNEPFTGTGLIGQWYAGGETAGAKSVLADDSAQGNDLVQATGSLQPTAVTGVQNGLSVLRFDGVDDFMAADAIGALLDGDDTPFSIFIACAFNDVSASEDNSHIWSCGKSDVSTQQRMRQMLRVPSEDDSVRFQLRGDTGAGEFVDDGAATMDTNFHLHALVFKGTTVDIYKNNVKVVDDGAITSVGDKTFDQFTVGARREIVASDWINMDFGEMRVYDAELNAEEINEIETEMNSTWSIFA